jgi:hypothetical protein
MTGWVLLKRYKKVLGHYRDSETQCTFGVVITECVVLNLWRFVLYTMKLKNQTMFLNALFVRKDCSL